MLEMSMSMTFGLSQGPSARQAVYPCGLGVSPESPLSIAHIKGRAILSRVTSNSSAIGTLVRTKVHPARTEVLLRRVLLGLSTK